MSRNLEAPDYMKDFEEVLNQVKNLVAPVDFYEYSLNNAVVSHYSTRLSFCKAGRAGDEVYWVRLTKDAYGDKLAVCLSTPSANVVNYIRDPTRRLIDCFKELHSCLEPRFSNEECIICSQEPGFNQLMWRLPCAHEMHYYCCLQWMERSRTYSCPFCRTVVTMDKSGSNCKGGIFVLRSQPITDSILNYISLEDLKRWQDAYEQHF